jgi:predicted metal-binding protein
VSIQAVDCFFTVAHLEGSTSRFSSTQSKAAIFTAGGTRGRVVVKTHKAVRTKTVYREIHLT